MARVALISCTSYDDADAAVTAALDLVGADALFAPDEKILLKPNLLTKATADGAVTTHPAVFAATAKYLRAHGCADLAYGDSPGRGSVETAAHACGIRRCGGGARHPRSGFLGRQNRSLSRRQDGKGIHPRKRCAVL